MSLTPDWQLESITLEGRHVRLEPLEAHHADALAPVALDPRIWEFSSLLMRSAADVQSYVTTALEHRRAGSAFPFVTVERQSGTAIGSTRFENIDIPNRRVEIGWTWLNPQWWRTPVNTEAKYLMLRHAFEQWGCVRVELKTWVNNHRSRAAIVRLGATEEGVLRRRMIHRDGSFRDAVYFSILDDEWPDAKRRLEARLEAGHLDSSR
jgi:RimJ/RimL family protein N-acetyltransferase